MKMNFKLFRALCLALICFFTFMSDGYADDQRGVTSDTLKIGVIGDRTGPATSVSFPIMDGMKNLYRYVNEHGGINGRKVNLIIEDDRYSIPMAIAAFKKLLYRDKILALMGPGSSAAAITLFRHIEKEKIPTLPIALNEKIVYPVKRYIFCPAETYPNTMRLLIDYMIEDRKPHDPRVALVYPDNETGKLDLESAIERLKFHKLTPVTKEVLNPGSLDAASQVMTMKRHQVNNIVLCGFLAQPAVVLLRELKKFKMDVFVFGNAAAASEEIIDMTGSAAEKYYAASPVASWYDEGAGVALMREVTLKYAPGTEKPYRGKFYTIGWVYALVLKEGLLRAGRDIDGERLVTALDGIKNFDMKGLSGPVSFSPSDHKGMNSAKVFKADPGSGKLVPMTGWKVSK
ncbi:MAG: amino acid/amide ABC transporter substrate-binding protein HAAT family [bacterium]|nr:MAG: amino acid/amide ABC transporter substrate-binding protein HAAT family [bacterium]